MDTAKNISCMKTVVVIIFSCFFLFIATQSVFCQQEKSKMLVQSINNTQNKTINNLSVIAYSGKIYLMWLVKGQQKNCTFFIERSVDSEHFEIKAAKSGYPSPFDKTIMYCYVDSTPFQMQSYYRITVIDIEDHILEELQKIKYVIATSKS